MQARICGGPGWATTQVYPARAPQIGLTPRTPGAVKHIETFVAALGNVVPSSRELVTHGDRELPIAFDLDDPRLQDRLGPIPRTSLHDGIAETFRRFVELRDQGRLDLSDLA